MLRSLVDTANRALQQGPAKLDLNASPDALSAQRTTLATAHYAAGLGYLGLNDRPNAKKELKEALEASPDNVGARSALADVE
jgi:Tfp pilus assembly protein PilF